MFLVIGLGNPGAEYARNRHNIGFMAVDEIVRRHSFGPFRAKFQGLFSEGQIGGRKVLVLKPQTYMNLSGQSVAAAARFLKIPVEDIIVLHDELDLPPGRVRVKRGGGAGGHNGLKSIDSHLGQNYRRVRLGIGHPGDKAKVSGYVLHDFAKADESWLAPLIDALADSLPKLLQGDEPGFMNKVSLATQPPKPKQTGKPAPEPGKGATQPAPPPPAPLSPMEQAMQAARDKADGPKSNKKDG